MVATKRQSHLPMNYADTLQRHLQYNALSKKVLSQSPLALICTDLDGTILLTEGGSLRNIGISRTTLIDRNIRDFPFGDPWQIAKDRLLGKESIIRLMVHHDKEEMQAALPSWNGSEYGDIFNGIWLESFNPLRSNAGRIIGILSCLLPPNRIEIYKRPRDSTNRQIVMRNLNTQLALEDDNDSLTDPGTHARPK